MRTRNTAQKNAIFSLLSSRKDHPSATQMYEDLKDQFPNISRATVYRVLNNAAEEGLVLRIHVGAEDRFDADVSGHCHIICTKCNEIYDAAFPKEVISSLESESGYKVSDRHVEFYGICPGCRGKE